MKYTIKYGFIISCLLLLASCQQSDLLEEVHNASASSRATQEASYFKNVERYVSDASGEVHIKGEIHCTEETEYTFIFSFQGSAGTSYEAWIGYNSHLFPANGSPVREIKTKLKPGIHICSVQIYFSDSDQQADARLVIRKINGTTAGVGEGSGDLVAQGQSKLAPTGGGESMHWTCTYCRFTLNGVENTTCISCGKPQKQI